MGKKVKGRWVYTIPKAVYVELWGDTPQGEVYRTRREAVKNGVGGKVLKFVPEMKARTYDGGPVLIPDVSLTPSVRGDDGEKVGVESDEEGH
jgi:hypothetical protein